VTLSTGEEAPVEEARVGLGRPLRVALLYGRDDASRREVARVALAAAAEPCAVVPTDDPRSFGELAQAFRDTAPGVVLVRPERKDLAAMAELLEALRLGCVMQRPAPRIFAIADVRAAEELRPAAAGLPFEVSSDERELVAALRAFRRGAQKELTLRDELIEDAARALAASSGADALVIDVSESSTSCVLARAEDLEAAHLVPLGLGAAADRVVARAGLDRVRRWLPRPVDAPALLERVFNRALWPGALPATESALALEMALAREAIAHALRDAEYAGLDVAAMRAAPAVLVTGRAASFPRAAQTLLVAVDGLEPTALTTVFREPDDGRAERIGVVLAISPRRTATVRLTHAGGRAEHRVARGSFTLVPMSGDVEVSVKGARPKGIVHAGLLGVLIDARGRPLMLPTRDAERIPAVSRWHITLRALPSAGPA
jgi:hypothetical protein